MKRILKSKLSVIRFFSLIFVSLAFISCGNLFENVKLEKEKTEEETQISSENPTAPENPPAAGSPETQGAQTAPVNQTFILTGSMVIDGAMPQIIAADASRSALPELSATTVEYFVYATDGDGNTVDGSFGSDENAKTFSIPLIFGRTWTITCGMRNKNGSQEEFLTASSTPKTYTTTNYTDPLVLYPVPATSGKGEVELSISIPSSITNVTVSCDNAAWTISTVDVTAGSGTTNGTALLKNGTTEEAKINSGLYKISLNFYKGTELVFQTLQSINVFYGLKTNKWYDAGAQASASPIQSDGTFVLTENHVKQFLSTNFYVGPTSASTTSPSDTNIGSHKAPFATLERALTQIENYGLPENDYKIHISDLVFPDASATEGYTISSSFDNKMKSLTLTGLTAVNANGISGNDRFRALTISTSKKVTIKNLTITNGKAENGAGIYYSGTGRLIIDNCIITDNEATLNGGGIYSTGNVQIISTTIKENDITGANAGTGEGLYILSGSVTMTGGEISQNISQLADSGAIFARKGAEFNFNGGLISGNGSRAIYNNGSINMTAGTISGHTAIRGGAIYNNGSLNISGGSITGNTATKNAEGAGGNGGAIYVNGADTTVTPNVIPSLEITGGTITANTAECFGGGIYNASKLTVSSGEISGNYITGTENCGGGAVAVYSETIIKATAYIPAGTDGKNDIYLYDSGDGVNKFSVLIASPLTESQTIKLTPKVYSENRPMIALAESSTADLTVEKSKFEVTQDAVYPNINWTLNTLGKLNYSVPLINKSTVTSSFDGSSGIGSSPVFKTGRNLGSIKSLVVSDHETTQGEYELYCKYGGTTPSASYGLGEYYPAYFVSWYDAIVYCNLRSMADGLNPVYIVNGSTDPKSVAWGAAGNETDGYCAPADCNWTVITDDSKNGWRLPYEAEWEYIWREGNLSSTGQHTYSGDNNADEVAWYTANSSGKSHIVKTKKANGFNVYDMSGNVWEWMNDWHSWPIPEAAPITGVSYETADPKNPVTRGGGWRSGTSESAADLTASSARNNSVCNARYNDLGFRVVHNAEVTTEAYPRMYIGSKTPSEEKAVGDIVFKDGSATPYVSGMSLSDAEKAAAIALIFYKGADCNDEGNTTPRTLGVGLKHNKDGIRWCRSESDVNSANAFNINITTIQCSVSGDAGALTITGDKNGSDNLEQIAAFLTANGSSDDTGTDENYPAFYFAKNYKNMEGSRVNGTAFADNWYLPSIAELYQIHLCIKDTMNGFNIDEASDALGGDKFTTSAYRSSSQCVESDTYVCHLYISTGMYRASIKAGSAGYICAIREF